MSNKTEQLKELGIDTEEGLACCADDEEFYLEMIEEYVREGKSRQEKLDACFAAEDWKNYSILSHSLKSTSRMIGAAALSELARELEFASREGDEEKVRSLHVGMMRSYEGLLVNLEGIIR